MYATHLATGSTLKCQTIQSGTIKGYLHDVAKFLGLFRAINPRFVAATDTKLAPVISKVLAEQKRWETVPSRREPFTLEMEKAIANLPSVASDACCLDAALANWTLCNLYAGCRGIEWAQTNCTHRSIHQFHKNRLGNAHAFTLQDVQCFTTASCPVSIEQAIATPNVVAKIKIAIRRTEKRRQRRMEIVHPQPFQPAPMLHIQVFGHPNLPPHTHGVVLLEPLPRSRPSCVQHNNRRHRARHASSRRYNLQFRPCQAQKAIISVVKPLSSCGGKCNPLF